MYLDYFGLVERPFSIAPDPQYLYMSARHKEAMAHLTYGLSQGGCFIVLTGEVGTGKTTLCRNLLDDLPDDVEVALILNANINEQELLQTVCDELKIKYGEHDSQKRLLDQINTHLLKGFASKQQTVLIIDEAQLLKRDVLEQIRLLTNLETTKSKLLQIILIGQPELNDVLSRNDLRQLAQRVTARYHLGPLERSEIEDYVNFRLRVAGCRKPLFTKQALSQLHKSTDGIPRRINVLADHALLSAYSKTSVMVDAKCVRAATKEVFIQTKKRASRFKPLIFGALALAVLSLNLGLWWLFSDDDDSVARARLAGPLQLSQPQQSDATSDLNDAADGDTQTAEQLIDQLNDEQASSVTTIIKSDAIKPGTVVIADEPLDEAELFEQKSVVIEQPPARVFNYDAFSKLGQALDASADLTSRTAAFRALAAAWDVDLPAQLIRPACETLLANGVDCLSVTTWAQLQRFNRPAILVLDQNNSLHRVIVFKLDANTAQVLVGQNVLDVSVAELRSRWTNNGITFWRPSEAGKQFLQQGDQSISLPAVRERINRASQVVQLGLSLDVKSTQFDQALNEAVRAMQRKYALVSDGKIGSETYLLINEILAPEQTPTLRSRVE